jgi:hypothetical protein
MIELPGVYRRRIRIAGNENSMSVDVEDDPHRFGVDLAFSEGRVTHIGGRAIRTPFTTCSAAALLLQQLVGTPWLRSPYAVLRQITLGEHCTHLIDMAALGISAAARGLNHRVYDVEISLRAGDRLCRRTAIVRRDDTEIMRCTLEQDIVVEPARYAGAEMRRAASWSEAADEEEIEAIFVVGRAMLVSNGRRPGRADFDYASELPRMRGACYTFQPARAGIAQRNPGNVLDFTDNPTALLADLAEETRS